MQFEFPISLYIILKESWKYKKKKDNCIHMGYPNQATMKSHFGKKCQIGNSNVTYYCIIKLNIVYNE